MRYHVRRHLPLYKTKIEQEFHSFMSEGEDALTWHYCFYQVYRYVLCFFVRVGEVIDLSGDAGWHARHQWQFARLVQRGARAVAVCYAARVGMTDRIGLGFRLPWSKAG